MTQENSFANMKDIEKKYQRKINLYADLIKLEKEEKTKSSKLLKEIEIKKKELEQLKSEYAHYKNDISMRRRNIKYDLKGENLIKYINKDVNKDVNTSEQSCKKSEQSCKKCGSTTVAVTPTRMFSGAIVNETRCSLCKTIISVDEI